MNNVLPTVRCSSLPRILSCTASSEQPKIIIDSSGGMARIGTAAHEFYASMVNDRLDEPGYLFDLSAKHNVDEEELRMLAWSGLREWKKLRDRIDVYNVEGEMSHVISDRNNKALCLLTGHPDLIGRLSDDPSTGVIIDWKTGYKENGYTDQTKGYALLDLLIYGNPNHPRFREEQAFVIPEKYLLLVVWTRLGITDTFEMPSHEIIDLKGQLCNIFTDEIKRYAPSEENCMYCPLATMNCPARQALMHRTAKDLLAIYGEAINTDIAPPKLAALYQQSRFLKKAIENYETMLKAAVEQAGGTIGFDGGEICLKETTRKTIYWTPSVINKFISEDILATLRPTISKDELDKAVSECAPRGQKATAKEECLNELKAAGSVEEKQVKSIEFRKLSLKGGISNECNT